jgi:hypothetical protein
MSWGSPAVSNLASTSILPPFTTPLQHLNPRVIKTLASQDEDFTDSQELGDDEAPEPHKASEATGLDSGEVLVAQILQAADDSDEAQETDIEDSASIENEGLAIQLVWETPVCTQFLSDEDIFILTIILQPALYADSYLIRELSIIQFISPPNSAQTRHVLYGEQGLSNSMFDPSDINRLLSPRELLNDVCINGCAALLQCQFSASTCPQAEYSQCCAILSTFDLPRARYKASDQDLWRHLKRSSYWTKDLWILPIHRPTSLGHWVLCVIALRSHEIYLFDSLVGQRAWKHDIKVCRLVYELIQ